MRGRRRLPLEALRPLEVELPASPAQLNLPALFGNDQPVELEVGFGKGAFLLAAAQARPDHNFLGVEIDRGLERYAATRLAKRGLANVKVICSDAGRLLAEFLTPSSLAAVHVYCPDPWWKKRHHKRRVFSAAFARNVERALQFGGRLLLATDVAAYFVVILETVRRETNLLPCSLPASLVATNFQAKALRRGKAIWRAAYQKP